MRFFHGTLVGWLFVVALSQAAVAQTAAGKAPLSIEAIFAPGGITGRGPETIKWSPDSSGFTFIQRDDAGE